MPNEFINYLSNVKNLKFEEKPDYLYLRRLFHKLAHRKQILLDNNFEWSPVKNNNN